MTKIKDLDTGLKSLCRDLKLICAVGITVRNCSRNQPRSAGMMLGVGVKPALQVGQGVSRRAATPSRDTVSEDRRFQNQA